MPGNVLHFAAEKWIQVWIVTNLNSNNTCLIWLSFRKLRVTCITAFSVVWVRRMKNWEKGLTPEHPAERSAMSCVLWWPQWETDCLFQAVFSHPQQKFSIASEMQSLHRTVIFYSAKAAWKTVKKGKRTEKENLKKDGNDISSCVAGKILLWNGMVANKRNSLLFGHRRRKDNPAGH